MSDFYTFDRANAVLPEVRETLEMLRGLRSEVIILRDRITAINLPHLVPGGVATAPPGMTQDEALEETRVLRLRLQGLVDQMQGAALRLDSWSIQLRDIETGLVDFPALVSGRPVWLCWRVEEPEVAWWHEVTESYSSRRRISDLV